MIVEILVAREMLIEAEMPGVVAVAVAVVVAVVSVVVVVVAAAAEIELQGNDLQYPAMMKEQC